MVEIVWFLAGIIFTLSITWLKLANEWQERRKIDARLRYLESNLLCGGRIFGCKGGPHCNADHK